MRKAGYTSVEDGLWLVTRPDLELLEVGTVTATVLHVGALYLRLVYVLPGLSSSEDIVDIFSVEEHLVLKLGLDSEHVGAGLAIEPEVSDRFLCQQDVSTGGAEQHLLCFLLSQLS